METVRVHVESLSWKIKVVKTDDVTNVTIIKNILKTQEKKKRKHRNLDTKWHKRKEKPKRMIPDFNSPSNSRYNSL